MNDSLQISLFEGSNSSALVIGDDVRQAVSELSKAEISKSHGSVFTKPEVVDFMLDLIGYESSQKLIEKRILEPSFGGGEFLLRIIERLLASLTPESIVTRYECLKRCIYAVELHRETYLSTKKKVIQILSKRLSPESSQELASEWLKQGDFLLDALDQDFDYVIGNPPYVRQESIPASLLGEYKLRYSTIYDRADLYIPFIERSLSLLNTKGALGFICSDRWMKNKYGGPLREFVARDFHLSTYVDMVDTDAFTQEVSAYPAITIFDRSNDNLTATVERPKINPSNLSKISHAIATSDNDMGLFRYAHIQGSGNAPWLIQTGDEIQLLRRLEGMFPKIEDTKCRIGIGVATGADHCFIAPFSDLDIEEDRKIPLVTTKDIKNGDVKWQGMAVVNPFTAEGSLVNLEEYPKLKRYLSTHEKAIKARHCAKKNPDRWYRTIDRIWPDLTKQHKLLIPDIKGSAHIVYEDGKLYPHHNLYYLTSSEWDLHAVQAVLLSSVTKLFISCYSTKMRGGYLRFQAQYLRRLRLPLWHDVSTTIRKELITAGRTRDLRACNEAIFALYGITDEENSILEKFNQ